MKSPSLTGLVLGLLGRVALVGVAFVGVSLLLTWVGLLLGN